MTFQEEKNLYLSNPENYTQQHKSLVNEYYILKKPNKNYALYESFKKSIKSLPETELIKAFQTAPKVVLEALENQELQQMADNFANLSAEEKAQLEARNAELFKLSKTQHEAELIRQAMESKILVPEILTLPPRHLIPYLQLVIEVGAQLDEYYKKYPVALVDAYKKGKQSPASQAFMLARKEELIYETKVSPGDKIQFLKHHPSIVYFAAKHKIEEPVQNFILKQALEHIANTDNPEEIVNLLQPIIHQITIKDLKSIDILNKRMNLGQYNINLAQYLYSSTKAESTHIAQLKEPVICTAQYLVEEIPFEKYLYQRGHYKAVIDLPDAATPYYVASALTCKRFDYIRHQDLDYVLKLKISNPALDAHIEKMLLDKNIDKMPEGSKFKL